MKTVVITGSTKGIGFGLAQAFLERGCRVVVNGRGEANTQQAAAKLSAAFPAERIFARAGDMANFPEVQALWDAAVERFGGVDIWVNNAGIAHAITDFWDMDAAQMRGILETNLLGLMYGTQVAIRGMQAQGGGAIYNMEGAGSTGRMHPGLTTYAATKRGVNYLNLGVIGELEGSAVILGILRPGMVITDLLTAQRDHGGPDWERTKRVFSIIGDKVETVTPWLADKMLANQKHGAVISFTSNAKIMLRFLMAPFNKRDLFDGE